MERRKKTFPEELLPITKTIIEKRLEKLLEERRKIGESGIPWPHEGPGIHTRLQQIEEEIFYLQKILAVSSIYPFPSSFSQVELGVGIRITTPQGEESFGFVSSLDVRYLPQVEGITWISPKSHLGKNLEGKKPQDEFNYTDPEGNPWKIKILELFSLKPFLDRLENE